MQWGKRRKVTGQGLSYVVSSTLLAAVGFPPNMSRRDVRTSSIDRSIWLDLSQETFRQHLVALEDRTNAVPIDARAFDPEEWLSISPYAAQSSYSLPLAIEQQLADDFACLVAVEEGAQSVAAVCIEEHILPPGLTLRFAALDILLDDTVRTVLQRATAIMATIASDSAKGAHFVPDYVDNLFHSVIQLHHRRLLAQLRSTKWEKPKHLFKSHKKALWQDFTNLLHRVQFYYIKKEKPLRHAVEKSLVGLASVYEGFEAVPLASEAEVPALKHVVDTSFTFCSTDTIKDFTQRLESRAGATPTKQVASAIKSLRQIQKIASYRQICVSLAETARNYPALFQNKIEIAYLAPFKSMPTTIGYEEWAKTCHVHAEVQLALHYDLLSQLEAGHPSFLRPRTIGISKWLCYLCYHFLKAHGQFFPSKTHGRLYDQWTIPDLAEFTTETYQRYRSIIKAIDDEVLRQTDNEPELWRVEPMTSVNCHFLSSEARFVRCGRSPLVRQVRSQECDR